MQRESVFLGNWTRVWVFAGAPDTFLRTHFEWVATAGRDCIGAHARRNGINVGMVHAHVLKVRSEKGALHNPDAWVGCGKDQENDIAVTCLHNG